MVAGKLLYFKGENQVRLIAIRKFALRTSQKDIASETHEHLDSVAINNLGLNVSVG